MTQRLGVLGAIGLLFLAGCGGGSAVLPEAGETLPPLAAPEGVAITGLVDAVRIEWSPVEGAEGYTVYVSPAAGIDPGTIAGVAAARVETVKAAENELVVLDLPSGTTWYAALEATRGEETSPLSTEASAVLPPAAPTNLVADAGEARITLAWRPSPGADAYDVYVASDSALTSTTYATLAGGMRVVDAPNPFVLEGATPDHTCYLLVVARNAGGRSPDSEVAFVTPLPPPPDDPPPSAVTDLAATGGFGRVTLTWSTTETDVTAVVYGAAADTISSGTWTTLPGGQRWLDVASPLVLEGLEAGVELSFVVTLERAGLEGPDSNVASATPDARGTFTPQPPHAVESGTAGVAVGDFDGDGVPDAASVSFLSGTLALLRGIGDGNLDFVDDLPVDVSLRDVVAADFDGDGVLDLAATAYMSDEVVLLLGDGDLGFDEAARFGTAAGPDRLALGDLDGDGNLDLVVTCLDGDAVSVLLGDGAGDFDVVDATSVGDAPHGLAVADLDGDGVADVASGAVGDDRIDVLLGDGDGTFTPADALETGVEPSGVVTADFDGDGNEDLVVLNSADATFTCWLGGGDGTFDALDAQGTGDVPLGAVAADFDGDGSMDLVVLNQGTPSLTVYHGDGAGGFELRQTIEDLPSGPVRAAVTDFDRDGLLDVCVTFAEGLVMVCLGNP